MNKMIFLMLCVSLLSGCAQKHSTETARLTPQEVIEIAKEFLIERGIDPENYYMCEEPELEDGDWLVGFCENGDPLSMRTTSYGIFVNDADPTVLQLSPRL